jgi:hypothetical protein
MLPGSCAQPRLSGCNDIILLYIQTVAAKHQERLSKLVNSLLNKGLDSVTASKHCTFEALHALAPLFNSTFAP